MDTTHPIAVLLRGGRLDEALSALQGQVRQRPDHPDSRVLLFALECILGRWDRARVQLDAVASLSQEWVMPAHLYRQLLACETARLEVFAGTRQPLILGEPEAWLGGLVGALALEAGGKPDQAWDLRERALQEVLPVSGAINGETSPWISDADPRLGPVLESYLEGNYHWIPFRRILTLESDPPEALVETVWHPVRIRLTTGADIRAHVPVRYPGTEKSGDGLLRLGRKTEWTDLPGGWQVPLGQRVLAAEPGDHGWLECRRIAFDEVPGELVAGLESPPAHV